MSFGSASGPVTVTGPSQVGINSSFNYTVDVEPIFSEYAVTMILSGYNLTNASPISPQYLNGTGAPSVFSLTAPNVTTTLFLFFQVKAKMQNKTYYYNLTETVKVKQFTILKATIRNPTGFTLNSINVSFSVGGKYVGSDVVNISRNSSKNVSYDWVSGNLATGVYTVSVVLNNSLVKIQNGPYSFKIQSGNPFVNYIYLGILAFFAIIIVVMLISGYYTRKRRPKWKK